MAGDLRSLGSACPALAHVEKQIQGSVDLLPIHRQVSVVGGQGLPVHGPPLPADPPSEQCLDGGLPPGWLGGSEG
jgi:hypothetical protein